MLFVFFFLIISLYLYVKENMSHIRLIQPYQRLDKNHKYLAQFWPNWVEFAWFDLYVMVTCANFLVLNQILAHMGMNQVHSRKSTHNIQAPPPPPQFF